MFQTTSGRRRTAHGDSRCRRRVRMHMAIVAMVIVVMAVMLGVVEARLDAEAVEQVGIALGLRIFRGQQDVSDENGVRAGNEAQRLQFVRS